MPKPPLSSLRPRATPMNFPENPFESMNYNAQEIRIFNRIKEIRQPPIPENRLESMDYSTSQNEF